MYGIPSLVVEEAEKALYEAPIVASLKIGVTQSTLVEFCDRASVDWSVTDGGDEPYVRPQTGTARFVLYGENGERFPQLMPGQMVEFSLLQGDIEMHVCAHRITQIDRGLSWRVTEGRREPFVTVTILTAGPLERFARVKVKKNTGDTWKQETDDVRAARLLALVDSAVPAGFSFTAKPDDPALALVADPHMLSFNDAGQPRHWGDEHDDLNNAWRIVPSTVVNTKAERTGLPTGALLRSYRPHMVNGPKVTGYIAVTGNVDVRVGVMWGTTSAQATTAPILQMDPAGFTRLNGVDVRKSFTLTLPATARWVRLVCEFQGATGPVGVERFWASTDPVAVGRVTLKNLPDADIENKAAGELLDNLQNNAHSGFYETRRGYLTYMNFDRLNALGQFTQPVQAVLGCNDVLSDVRSSVRAFDRINQLQIGYLSGTTDVMLTVTDAASVANLGLYEKDTGGDIVGQASAKVLADDFMDSIGAITVSGDKATASGKASEPRERVDEITTVPFHHLEPHQVKELMQLSPMACVRIDNAPKGFPHSALDQWVGAVLGSTLTGSSNRRTSDGRRTVNVSMTLNVIDMTKVSETPAVVVTVDRTEVFEGVPVVLSYKAATAGEDAPIGSTYQWQYRRGTGSWTDYPSAANPLSWPSEKVGTVVWRVRLTTPDGATFDSPSVQVVVKANIHTSRVDLAAPGGVIAGQTIRMSTTIDADTSVASYEWWYLAPGGAWTRWSPTAAAVDWSANTPGVWQWKVTAVHFDGFRVESAIESVWVGQSFTATVSSPSAPTGTDVVLTANAQPSDHGATVVGWERQDGDGPWVRTGLTANPLTTTVTGVHRWRFLLEFPDGTVLTSTVATVNASDPPIVVPPPTGTQQRTVVLKATASRSYVASGALRYASQYDRAYHGYFDGTNGQQKSVLIFPIPAEVANAASIDSASLRVTRTAGGNAGSQNVKIGVHTAASPQTTYGAVTGKQENLQSIAGPSATSGTSATKVLALTAAVYSKFKTAKGLILGPSSADYQVLYGVGGAGGAAVVADNLAPTLTITYTVNV